MNLPPGFCCRFGCSHYAHLHPTRCLLPPPGKISAVPLPAEDRGKCAGTHTHSNVFLTVSFFPLYPLRAWITFSKRDSSEISTDPRRASSHIQLHSIPPLSSLSSGGHLPNRGNHLHDWQLVTHRPRLDPQPPRLQRWSLRPPLLPRSEKGGSSAFPFIRSQTLLIKLQCTDMMCCTGLRHLQFFPLREYHWRETFCSVSLFFLLL